MSTVGVLQERAPERRVALVPGDVTTLVGQGHEVVLERGAGSSAGWADSDYVAKGARTAERSSVLEADVLVQVRALDGARAGLHRGQCVVGLADPLRDLDGVRAATDAGVTLFALELLPRTTRAQAMDVLSSQSALAGYRAALLGAERLGKVLPMMSTAAGTLPPSKVLVIGAGVAGLSAIATARRLGAVVSAYDVRPEAREQVLSVGAAFVELPLVAPGASGAGGYAAQMGPEFYRRQQELLAEVVAASDIVISTAQVPGRPAPLIVTKAMVEGMTPGSVVVDIAAGAGGNCELTRPDELVEHGGVVVLGPTTLATSVPTHASQLFSRNVTNFLKLVLRPEGVHVDLDDPVVTGPLVTHAGEVVHPSVLELLATTSADPGRG
jgi:proton-translocating NAD(P)+ transhydrogenase subunit alpha